MSEETRGTTRVVGTLASVDGRGVVRMEDRYDTDIDDLWSALTDPQRLARWVASVEGDLRLGGEFRAHFTSGWEGSGRVDTCEPPRRLLVTMAPGEEDETVIEAELAVDGDRTRLVIESVGFRSTRSPRTGPAGRRTSRTSPPISAGTSGSSGAPGGPSSSPRTASRPRVSPARGRTGSRIVSPAKSPDTRPSARAHSAGGRTVRSGGGTASPTRRSSGSRSDSDGPAGAH